MRPRVLFDDKALELRLGAVRHPGGGPEGPGRWSHALARIRTATGLGASSSADDDSPMGVSFNLQHKINACGCQFWDALSCQIAHRCNGTLADAGDRSAGSDGLRQDSLALRVPASRVRRSREERI